MSGFQGSGMQSQCKRFEGSYAAPRPSTGKLLRTAFDMIFHSVPTTSCCCYCRRVPQQGVNEDIDRCCTERRGASCLAWGSAVLGACVLCLRQDSSATWTDIDLEERAFAEAQHLCQHLLQEINLKLSEDALILSGTADSEASPQSKMHCGSPAPGT